MRSSTESGLNLSRGACRNGFWRLQTDALVGQSCCRSFAGMRVSHTRTRDANDIPSSGPPPRPHTHTNAFDGLPLLRATSLQKTYW